MTSFKFKCKHSIRLGIQSNTVACAHTFIVLRSPVLYSYCDSHEFFGAIIVAD